MKKSILLVVALAATMTAQASTITWGNLGTTSPIVGLDGTTKLTSVAAIAANFQIIAMYMPGLYADAVAAIDTGATAASINTKTAGQLTGGADSYTYGAPYTTGAQFFLRATAKFGTKSYYMDVFKNNTFGTTWATTAINNTQGDTFSWSAANYGGVGVAGQSGKWVAVPEPASGLLALAGAALLIRRRRRG